MRNIGPRSEANNGNNFSSLFSNVQNYTVDCSLYIHEEFDKEDFEEYSF